MEDIVKLLKTSRYQDNPIYNGRYLFPNTGNIHDDWEVFSQTIDILTAVTSFTIEDYFYWLSFNENILRETKPKGFNSNLLDIVTFDGSPNFTLTGALGSLVPGYGLIFPREHALSISMLSSCTKLEYIDYLNSIRDLFSDAFGKRPIAFEHGSNTPDMPRSNSINHAHTHIVNHHFLDEQRIISELGMVELSSIEELLDAGIGNNYISYISPDDRFYYTDSCLHESQLMRKYVARDIGLDETWDWRKTPYYENIFETAKGITLQRIRVFDK